MEIKRIFDLLAFQQKAYPNSQALNYKAEGIWHSHSLDELITNANLVSLGLLKYGIGKNDKVAIISYNRPEWNFVDFGIQQIGAVSVPIYPNSTEADYRFIFSDAEVKAIFVSSIDIYQKANQAIQGLESVKYIFTFDVIEGAKHWTNVLEEGRQQDILSLESHKNQVKTDDLLTIIYTSGTTGTPKGVMLNHSNIISNFTDSLPAVPIDHRHKVLSFLPLCHIFERMLIYLYIRIGAAVYYAENMDTIADNLKEVKPHLFTTVPRLLEKVYDKILTKGYELTGIKKSLFFWALNLGLKYDTKQNLGLLYNIQLALANKLIFNKWREALGGNIIAIVSGGAALQPRLARVFWSANIKVLEGYGLTETSPVIAVNRVDDCKIGTVGLLIDNVSVKIAEDGEILVKGPNIMQGYYKRPDLTNDAIDTEGWFHTGDIGELVDGKYLKITDRKKEIFKTSGGKYIAPQQIENKLKESLVIEQVMVVGEGQKFASALIVPAFKPLNDWCELKGLDCSDLKTLLSKKEIIEKYQKEIDIANNHFSQVEKIKKFVLVPETWTVESGELTPTLKLKRKILLNKYKNEIDSLYKDI